MQLAALQVDGIFLSFFDLLKSRQQNTATKFLVGFAVDPSGEIYFWDYSNSKNLRHLEALKKVSKLKAAGPKFKFNFGGTIEIVSMPDKGNFLINILGLARGFTTDLFERVMPSQSDLKTILNSLSEDPHIQIDRTGNMLLGWGLDSPGAGKPIQIPVSDLVVSR